MIEAPKHHDPRINLREATVLCVDDNVHGLDILCQVLMGFGVTSILRATSSDGFKTIVAEQACDP